METIPPVRSYDEWIIYTVENFPEYCTCKACYKRHVVDDRMLLDLYGVIPDWKHSKYYRQSLKEWNESCPQRIAKYPAQKKSHKGNGVPKGLWAGTLTVSPTDPYNEEDMIIAIRKIFKQETCPVEKYAWYLEYTENGLPHIHFVYKTPEGGRIHAKVFKRIWKIWDESIAVGRGHRGGYHRLCADEDGYLKYISKDNGRHDSNWSTN